MSKTLVVACATLFLGASTASFAGGPLADPGKRKRAKASILNNSSLVAGAVHSTVLGGDGIHAGANTTSESRVRGVGKSIVEISASWDWSTYGGDHPCALVDTVPHSFAAGNLPGGPFDTTATVTIRHPTKADTITAAIRGGSSCEIVTDAGPPACTANELMIAFTVTGGEGRYAAAAGSGSIRTVVDGCAAVGEDPVVVSDLILRMQK